MSSCIATVLPHSFDSLAKLPKGETPPAKTGRLPELKRPSTPASNREFDQEFAHAESGMAVLSSCFRSSFLSACHRIETKEFHADSRYTGLGNHAPPPLRRIVHPRRHAFGPSKELELHRGF
jgi:hypothetical protein